MIGVFADGKFAFIDRDASWGASDDMQRAVAFVVEVSEEGARKDIVEFPAAQS